MPTVKPGESEQKFVSRCVPIMMDEGRPQTQSIAICYSIWRRKNEENEMNIIKKIDILLKDETVTGDIETNTAKGKVDVLGGDCPKGQQWCPEKKKCVPIGSGDGKGIRSNESIVLGGGYIDGNTSVAGSGQTRVVGKDSEIIILKTKSDITTKFNRLLGAYVVADGKILGKNKNKKKAKKKDRVTKKGPNAYGLMFDE